MKQGLAALVLLLAACNPGPPPPDMKDPLAVAGAFVSAFNTRDLSRMLPLVDQVNLDAIKEALAGGPDSEAWRGIFDPEMVEILARQDGKVEGPRYDGREALVKVGASGDGDIYAIGLEQGKDQKWLIVEHAVLSEAKYLALDEKSKH